MRRYWKLPGVLVGLVVLAMACGEPMPTPTTLATATATFTPAPTTASVPTPTAEPTPAFAATRTPASAPTTPIAPTPTATPYPTPTPTLPNCATDPVECEFPINEARAIEIAREAGLEPGVGPWRANFGWHAEEASYAWWVMTTLRQSSDGGTVGRSVAIDANTGDVIEFNSWAVIPEDEGILLIKSTPEYKSLVDKYGSDHVSVKAVNLDDKDEADFLRNISDGFLMEPGCIIVLKAGKGEGYVYQLDEEFRIVSRMTLSDFEEGARNVDAGTMEHFYSSLK